MMEGTCVAPVKSIKKSVKWLKFWFILIQEYHWSMLVCVEYVKLWLKSMAILIREGINYIRRSDLEENVEKEIESTYLEIRAKNGKKILMGSLYHSPNVNENKFLRHIRETLPKIQNEKGDKNIILGMDHNLDLLKCHIHQNTQLLIDIMTKDKYASNNY